jgi:hypothetical protein
MLMVMSESEPWIFNERVGGWILLVTAGFLGSISGLLAFVVVVTAALDASGQTSASGGLVLLALGLPIATAVAYLGFRRLGVTTNPRRIFLGVLTALVGFTLPWFVTYVIGILVR